MVTNTLHAAIMASSAYQIPCACGRVRSVVTNTVPITAYRGAGRPDAVFMLERLVEEAAQQVGIDRLQLRRLNFIPRDAFPYRLLTAPMPMSYDSGDFVALLARAELESGWADFPMRQTEAASRGRLRGIGCAVFIEPSGGVSPSDEALITFEPDGAILIHEVAVASGQGHETVFPELVGRVLQVDPARITLRAGRADGPALKGAGAVGSRSLMTLGSVCTEAANVVLRKGRSLAAEALEAAEADIAFSNGAFRVDGTDRVITLTELARRRPGGA